MDIGLLDTSMSQLYSWRVEFYIKDNSYWLEHATLHVLLSKACDH